MKKTNYAESETGDFNSCVTIKAIQILILKIPSKKKNISADPGSSLENLNKCLKKI